MKGSLVIVTLFIVGVLIGLYQIIPIGIILDGNISYYTICTLMFCVGISIGSDPKILKSLKTIDLRLALLPVMTITGTLLGCGFVSLFLDRSATECMAVGSGFGYYSLSSIFITEYKGIELGTIALLSNIIREAIALICAPLLVYYFGKLAPISVGGATTMDTTLPIITKYSGKEFIVVAIFHGFVVDLSVPILVTLFCTI